MDSQSINRRFRSVVDRLATRIEALPWHDQEVYAEWLAQTYYLVRHTTRFLGLAAGKLGLDEQHLHLKALEHIREEKGHDVLALNDLKALGRDINDYPELPQTAALYHAQYYYIEHLGPISHYGYSLLLEGLAAVCGAKVVDVITKAHGRKASSFLKVHATEDVKHFGTSVELLESVSPRDLEMVFRNLEESRPRYDLMLDAVEASAAARRTKVKAVA